MRRRVKLEVEVISFVNTKGVARPPKELIHVSSLAWK